MKIYDIIAAFRGQRLRVTDHADEEAENDGLSLDDVAHALLGGEIIEDYPDDRPYPNCLVLGESRSGDPIHSVWAYNEVNQWAVLITVYRPDPLRWIDWRTRRRT